MDISMSTNTVKVGRCAEITGSFSDAFMRARALLLGLSVTLALVNQGETLVRFFFSASSASYAPFRVRFSLCPLPTDQKRSRSNQQVPKMQRARQDTMLTLVRLCRVT